MMLVVDAPIKTIDGSVIRKTNDPNSEVATFRFVFVNALLADSQEKISGKDKFARWKLAEKIEKSTDSVSLSTEEVLLLQNLVAELYPTAIAGYVMSVLEGTEIK